MLLVAVLSAAARRALSEVLPAMQPELKARDAVVIRLDHLFLRHLRLRAQVPVRIRARLAVQAVPVPVRVPVHGQRL